MQEKVLKTVGIIAPPKKPCNALKIIMDSILVASEHNTLITVNPKAAIK